MRRKTVKRVMAAVLETAMATSLVAGGVYAGDAADSEPVEIRIFSAYDSTQETEVSKFMVQRMEEALNIKLVREEIPSSAYSEKLQLSLADGDYPDAYIFNSHTDPTLISAIENGLVIPVNEYLEGKENILNYTYDGAFEAAKVMNDDNIYIIPRTTVSRVDGFAVRKDWMDALGIELTSDDYSMSPDEFLDMLKQFTYGDPDGDGVDNTFGIIYEASNGVLKPMFSGAFGCYGWQESDGEYAYMDPTYEIGNESYRKALEFSREVYQYAHPDSVITTDYESLFSAGGSGARPCFAGHISDRQQKLQALVPTAELTYISGISDANGELHNANDMPGIWGGVAITTACEHPEKVVEMIDWLLGDEAWEYALYGEPGYTYNKNDDGTCTVIPEPYAKERLTSWSTQIARRKEDVNFFLDLSLPEEELDEARKWLQVAVDAVVFPKNYSKQPSIATDTEFIEVEARRKEVQTKIIMGSADISEYDDILTEWYEKGGKEYVEEMNEIISNMNK